MRLRETRGPVIADTNKVMKSAPLKKRKMCFVLMFIDIAEATRGDKKNPELLTKV